MGNNLISIVVNNTRFNTREYAAGNISDRAGRETFELRGCKDVLLRDIKKAIDQAGSASISMFCDANGSKLLATVEIIANQMVYQYVGATGEEKISGECKVRWA